MHGGKNWLSKGEQAVGTKVDGLTRERIHRATHTHSVRPRHATRVQAEPGDEL